MALKTITAKALSDLLDAATQDTPVDLSGYDLKNADLSGRDLSKLNIDFSGSDLRGINLQGTTFGAGTNLKGAKVDEHDFINGGVDLTAILPENMPDNPALKNNRAQVVLSTATKTLDDTQTALTAQQQKAGMKDEDIIAFQQASDADKISMASKLLDTRNTEEATAQSVEEKCKSAYYVSYEANKHDKAAADAAYDAAHQAAVKGHTVQNWKDTHEVNLSDPQPDGTVKIINDQGFPADQLSTLEAFFNRPAAKQLRVALGAASEAENSLTDAKKRLDAAQQVVTLVPTLIDAQHAVPVAQHEADGAQAAFDAYVKSHESHGTVAKTQKQLDSLHARDAGDITDLGIFGPALYGVDNKKGIATTLETLHYQAEQGLPQTGNLNDHATHKRMNQDIQQALVDMGLLKPAGKETPESIIDGVLGKHSHDAIKAFQKANGLPETGKPDGDTLEKLQSKYHYEWLKDPQNKAVADSRAAERSERQNNASTTLKDPAALLNVAEYDATKTGIQTGTGLRFSAGKEGEITAFLHPEQREHFTTFAQAHPDIMGNILPQGVTADIEKGNLVLKGVDGMDKEGLAKLFESRFTLQRILAGDEQGAVKADKLIHPTDKTSAMGAYQAAEKVIFGEAASAGKTMSQFIGQEWGSQAANHNRREDLGRSA